MEERSPGGSALLRFWRGWRREILRGLVMFTVVVVVGLAIVHFFRSFRSGWSDPGLAVGGLMGGGHEWHEAFVYSGTLKPGEKVWIRNRTGAVTVWAAAGESLLVVGQKRWRRSSPEMVDIVSVPHAGGVTICALWAARSRRCGPEGDYGISNPKGNDVVVRFQVHVPRGAAIDASTVDGVLEIHGVQGAVTAESVNGQVRAEVVATPFSASTVNGTIRADVALAPGVRTGDISLETVNGSITAALARGLNAEVEASTVNGRIETDYPVAVSGRLTSKRLAGRLGAGGPKLHLEAVNGSIRLLELGKAEVPQPHAPTAPAPPARTPGARVRS